jgi:hypothetical protein
MAHPAASLKPGIGKVSDAVPKTAAAFGKMAAPPTLAQQAQTLAQQAIAAQVAAIQQQQNQANTDAQARAQQINQASLAASQYVSGLGTPTYNTYKDAATTLAGLSQGFSGQLQTDAGNQAAKVQADLAAAGSPQTAQNNGASLANVLYGMRGLQPASTLLNAGTAAASHENAVPSSILGYGQDLAAGALGAGKAAASALTPSILAARAQAPTLATQYLASLNDQATKQQTLAVQQALAQSLIGSRQTSAAQAAAKLKLAATQGAQKIGIEQQNANTSASRASAANEAAAVRNEIAQYNSETARYRALHPSSTMTKPPTTTQQANWLKMADNFYHGVAPTEHYDSASGKFVVVPGTGQPPVTYPKAMAALMAVGASKVKAAAILNSIYAPGEGGRPAGAPKFTRQQKQQAAAGGLGVVVTNPGP